MNKKVLSMLCALALVLGVFLVMGSRVQAEEVTDPTTETTEATEVCPACGETITGWETLTADTVIAVGGHYRLSADVTRKFNFSAAGTVCLDLAGCTLNGSGRVMLIGSSNKVASVVNILDSSAAGTGTITGTGGSSYAGGIVYNYAKSTINMYGGTICPSTDKVVAYSGGTLSLYGTFNLYGGSIVGGTLGGTSTQPHVGGTAVIQSTGALNLYGGSVLGGTAESVEQGHCVYVKSSGKVTLTDDANVAEIAFAASPASHLTINGTYTGTAALRYSDIASGDAVATLADSADISGATITIADSTLMTTVTGTSLVVGEGYWCEACRETVIWQNLSATLPTTASGHYRLTQNVGASQITLKTSSTICLDLAGYSYTSSGRAFVIGDGNSGTNGEILNIMDSSAKKTGALKGCGGSDAYAGGVVYSYKNTTVNIYSGIIEAIGSGNVLAKNGGALDTYGAINMYGGTVIGNHVASNGGTVCLLSSAASFNMEGGTLISGTADGLGDCLYVASGAVVQLSGDASPEQIYFAGSSASKLTITDDYTGKTELAFASIPATGADIGNCSGAVGKESIAIADTRLYGAVSGSNLVVAVLDGVSLTDTAGNVAYYDTLAAAVAVNNAGSVIKLLADNGETVTVSGDATLDLFGWDITGNITVNNGTLYVKDSVTDDNTVNDTEGYGVITGTVTGTVKPCENYLELNEADGDSYHRYILELTKVSLRPGNTGIYYSSDILMNEAVLQKIDHYGITVSTNSKTPTADPADAASIYTAYTKADYGITETRGVVINGIMEQEDGADANTLDAETMIYGRPYICFTDGTYFYGGIRATNLRQLTELVSEKAFDGLSLTQHRAIMDMYETFRTTMDEWGITSIKQGAAAGETAAQDKVLKVLMIGNSHGLDSTNLLYEVFKAEGLPEGYDNLVLGAIYTGGCSVSTHAKNAWNDLPYDYWKKNDGSKADGSWIHTEDPTMREVLEDEDWDIVLLQEMNTSSARESYFQNDNIEMVFTFVVNTLGYEPEFMWNMIWANPEIPESYVNYLYADGDDGSGGDVGSGAEGDDNDTSDATTIAKTRAWIFQTQRPGALETWGKNYVKLWENNRQVMYNNIVSNVHNYVIGKEVHNIGYDDVMPNATAIQYAIEWMGMEEQDMYRDYTHVSDLGRLTVSYLWYAKLTGKTSIEAPKYTLVSQVLENSRQPLGYAKDYSQYSDVIRQSVNFALADHYGVIQNLTYAEYLALTAEEQAAYEASFEAFSVNSGWTYEKWLEAAVAGVTYTDYARMTDEQKTAYAALRSDFDTWYNGVVENLTYAEYFILADAEKTAYATLRGNAFGAWLAEASAAFTYSDYVMMTYEQQLAYQETFAEGEFDTLYASWLANMTYEEFMGLTMHQKVRYKATYKTTDAFLTWYEAAKAAYESANA